MRWLLVALVAQSALLAYWIAIVLIPLGAWNDQPGRVGPSVENFVLLALLGGPTAVSLVAFAIQTKWLASFGVVFYGIWLWLQVQGSWAPYLFGASDAYAEMYERVFGRTTKLLPSFPGHPAPDAMHLVLQLLLALALATGVGALVVRWSAMSDTPFTRGHGDTIARPSV